MFNIFRKYHFITNFPKGYPFYKKIVANIVFFLTGIIIHPRRNLLTHKDLVHARWKVRKGDVALMGNLRESSALFIKGVFTHSAIYAGRKKFINAVGDGVQYMSLHHVFTEYDTLALLRIPKGTPKRRKIKRAAINFAKAQFGKPYDFDFSKGEQMFFCTELVNSSYHHAGFKTGVANFGKFLSFAEKIEKLVTKAPKALLPDRFLQGNFEIVYLSHNLARNGKKVELVKS